MRVANVDFELYNHPEISLVNVNYEDCMRTCDSSEIRVWDKNVRFVVFVIIVTTITIIIIIFVIDYVMIDECDNM